MRGAWIEITSYILRAIGILSLPVRGAWIEITTGGVQMDKINSRSPCGERGLKFVLEWQWLNRHMSLPVRGAWIEISSFFRGRFRPFVAPRAGSVD